MYSYTEFDDKFLAERNAQFRAQVERRIDGDAGTFSLELLDHSVMAHVRIVFIEVRTRNPFVKAAVPRRDRTVSLHRTQVPFPEVTSRVTS